MQREEGRRQSGCLFLAKRWCLCVYVDASESSEFFVMLRKALPFLVYIIVVRGEVSVRLEDVIRTISVVKAEQLSQHSIAHSFSLSLFLSQFFRKCISKTRWIHSNYFKTVLKTFENEAEEKSFAFVHKTTRDSARPFKLFSFQRS